MSNPFDRDQWNKKYETLTKSVENAREDLKRKKSNALERLKVREEQLNTFLLRHPKPGK